jgi:hypothetical protein
MNTRFCLSAVLAAALSVPLAASAQEVVVNVPPPAAISEHQPPAPGPNYTWVGGYWNWNGSRYTWTAGRWEQTPTTAQAWEPPRWEHEGQGYRFRPGRWHGRNERHGGMMPSNLSQPTTVVVGVAPPRPRMEHRIGRPQAGQTWVPGYWSWNGSQHVWNAGRWETPPTPHARWNAPRWEHRGRQWQWEPGQWR